MKQRGISRRGFLKTAAAAGTSLALGGVLEACAPGATPTPAATAVPATEAPAAEPVTLRFWHQWGGSRTELLQAALDQFMADHPNIKVQADLHGWDVWPTEQMTAVASGDVPELALGAPIYVPEFADSGALLPLTPYITQDNLDLSNILLPSEHELTQYKGDTWLLPMTTNGGANIFYYNKKLFEAAGLDPEKPPATWQELEDAHRAITKIEGGRLVTNGITIVGSLPIVHDFKHWLITNDAEWISQDGKTVMFNQPNGLETLEWVVNMADISGGWDKVAATSGSQEEAIFQALYASKEAMYVSGPWMFNLIQSNAADVYENLGVAMRPRNKGEHVGGIVGDGVALWLLAGNKHPEESWQLLRWLTVDDGGACNFLKAQVRPSPVNACSQDPHFAENNPWWDTVVQVLQNEVPFPRTPVNPKLDDMTLQMLEQALFKQMTPQEAIEWGAEQCQAILDEHWATAG
jgi:multiple sugar transport system substrate-binding protein